jgi:hypothetical protein
MDERPEAQWSGDPLIAEQARRWQVEQHRVQQRRGSGGWLGALVLAVLVVVWLALCGVVAAASFEIATASDGAEVLFLAPPVYVVLSAVGTGLVVDIRSRILGRGPSVGHIVGCVIAGTAAALAIGTGLAFALTGLSVAVIGDDFLDPVVSAAWMVETLFVLVLLPVVLGIGAVLVFVSGWTFAGRRRHEAR